ncbi:MAG TPA: hypothetical protein DCL41_08765, partial [Bdellovibrionales bacterium]|nr:hypothetical protein [Bdellovibrionales bacterium]
MIHIILFVITISISVFSPKVHAVKSCSESGHTLRRPLISDVPTSGHFKLYFEVNKNFNPNYPTTLAIYDGQQPTDIRGLAEESKLKYYNNENINIVFVQYRGIFCSKFPAQIEQDQVTPFLSNEAIEDFEAVRRELLGNSKWMIVGGSGGALLALQYLAKYPNSVSKAF